MFTWICLVVVLLQTYMTFAGVILIAPYAISHKKGMVPTAMILAERGHNVTILTIDIQGGGVANHPLIRDISLVLTPAQIMSQMTPTSWTYYFPFLAGWFDNMCKAAVSANRSVFEQLATEQFDLVILDGQLVISSHLIGSLTGGDVTYFTAGLPSYSQRNAAGIPLIPSVSPRFDSFTCDVTNSFESRLRRIVYFYYGKDFVLSILYHLYARDAKLLSKTIMGKMSERTTAKKRSVVNAVFSTNPPELHFVEPINHNLYQVPMNCEKPTGTLST